MEIIVFDVGNASCNYICSPNKYAMMIDCGSCTEKENPIDVLNELVGCGDISPRNYVTKQGKSYPLALLHITHPDDDHVRNSDRVYKELTPYLLRHTYTENFDDAKSIDNSYKQKLDLAYRGFNHEKIDWGFDVNKDFCISVDTVKSTQGLKDKVRNNNSIIRFIEYKGVRFLFTGDLETAGWDWLIANDKDFVDTVKNGVDVLIAPHHGHESGFPKALFDLIGNVCVIILSKDTEASKEESDVYSNYSAYATGVKYTTRKNEVYEGKVLTTRSNGGILIEVVNDNQFSIYTDKASSNHKRIKGL